MLQAIEGVYKAIVHGARLGRDRNGNPAWFLADPDRAGEYLKVDL